MNWIDAIILLVVIAIIGGVIAFNILSRKRGNSRCSKCAYARDCSKQKNKFNEENKIKCNSKENTSINCPYCNNKEQNK